MARRTTFQRSRQISELNMTPLMDLTFLLLITFIITFPLIEQGVPVNLPKGEAAPLDESHSCAVTLNAKGEYYLDDDPISADELKNMLTQRLANDPDVTILVRADESIVYGKVVDLLRILHSANITRMALVTNPEGAGATP